MKGKQYLKLMQKDRAYYAEYFYWRNELYETMNQLYLINQENMLYFKP